MQNADDTELAIHHIRRIVRLGDLEQIRAVLEAKRIDLMTRRQPGRGDGPVRPLPNGKQKPPTKKEKGPTPVALDPEHKNDPAFILYKQKEKLLNDHMKANGLTQRSAVPPEIRDDFQKALAEWKIVKPKYQKATTATAGVESSSSASSSSRRENP